MAEFEEKVRLPRNVRQVGELSGDWRIYIEDYAYTYASGARLGMLLGESVDVDGCTYVFIRAAVGADARDCECRSMGADARDCECRSMGADAKDCECRSMDADARIGEPVESRGIACVGDETAGTQDALFSSEALKLLESDRQRYFNDLEQVGWFFAGNEERLRSGLSTAPEGFWEMFCRKGVVMLADEVHGQAFFIAGRHGLMRQGGYMCFYERNEAMREYMLGRSRGKSVDGEACDTVTQNFRSVLKERKAEVQRRQGLAVLYCVCGIMAVMLTVIGVNLAHSFDKMQKLDASVDKIAKEIANMSSEGDDFLEEGGDEAIVTMLPGNVYPTQEAPTVEASTVEEASDAMLPNDKSQGEGDGDDEPFGGAEQNEKATTVQKQTDATPVISVAKSYVVKKGDTLMSICKNEYGDIMKYRQVMEANDISDPDRIYEGQQLVLP